uniref:Uncharacterized protein n=1 Tax=Angiostrongylus cantonensis TaxID=6313 RepID=A0A0K0CYD3_ANGCA
MGNKIKVESEEQKKSSDFSEWGGYVDITSSKFLGDNNNIAAAGSQEQLGGEELVEVVEKNGFGITGFKVRKVVPSEKRRVHSGEVTLKPKSSLHDNEFSPVLCSTYVCVVNIL